MHELHELKEMLMDEIRAITKKGELTAGSLDTVDKLLNSIKNACKIVMYDEYRDESGYSNEGEMHYVRGKQGGGYSNARGGQRRDSRGRYSREGRYSYADSDEKIELLRDMMNEVSTEEEKRVIRKLIREMENE